MSRSLKKGPFIEPKLLKKIEAMNSRNKKRVIRPGAAPHDLPADGRPHNRGTRWPPPRADLHHREYGRSQAR